MTDETEVRKALETVIDPELNLNIVELGLIYGIKSTEKEIEVDITLTSPMCPAGPQIIGNAEQAVKDLATGKETRINLVWIPPWNPERMTIEAKLKVGLA